MIGAFPERMRAIVLTGATIVPHGSRSVATLAEAAPI